jgi:hypothetical protein
VPTPYNVRCENEKSYFFFFLFFVARFLVARFFAFFFVARFFAFFFGMTPPR